MAGGSALERWTSIPPSGVPEYRSVSNFQTSGMVNAFWQAEIQATSSGKIGGKTLEPGLYDSFDINRTGKKQQVSLTYENGQPRLFADPVYSTTGYEVKPEEQKNTLDPLSALHTFIAVSGVGADAGNPCSLTAPGIRRAAALQYRDEQGEGHRYQDGQWPLCRQGSALPDQVPRRWAGCGQACCAGPTTAFPPSMPGS